MRRTKILPSLAVTAIMIMGGLTAASPAAATAAGIASAGSATVQSNGDSLPIAPVGPCSLTGQRNGESNGASNDIVTFGPATSTCTDDAQNHTSSSVSNGSSFTLSALENYGGPTIKIASYQVTCTATQTGTNAGWQFSGLTGISVPQQIPNNFHVDVTSSTGTLLATVILNEIILPNPNDGSITENLVHIILFPNGTPPGTTPLSGDVYVGQTACSPTA